MTFDKFKVVQTDDSKGVRSGLMEDLITFAFLLAMLTLMFSPVLFSGRLLAPDDGIHQNLPNFFAARTLWTPYLCAGFPLAADPQVQYFYPPAVIFAHLPYGWNLYILLAYALAGFFLYKYIKLLTASWYSALVAAFAFTFSGYLLSEVNHMHVVHNSFWLTFLLLAFEKLARRLEWQWFVSAACATTLMIFCGHMQHCCYTLALSFLYILLRGLGTEAYTFFARLKYFFCSYSALALGLAMASVQLLPTMELASFSGRASFSFQDFLSFSMSPLQATGLFFPYLFGGAVGGIINIPSFAAFGADTSFVYVGFIPMAMAGMVSVVFRKNILVLFWLAIGLLAFFLSFGDATPLGWLVYHIPQYGSFRCLHRTLLYSALATSILLGLAIASCLKGEINGRVLTNSLLTNAVSMAVILAGAATVSSAMAAQALTKGIEHFSVYPWENAALGLQCIYFSLSSGTIIYFWHACRKNKHMLFVQILLMVVLCADLTTTGWYAGDSRWRLSSPKREQLLPVTEVSKLAPLLAREHQRFLPVRGASGTEDEIPANISRLWGLESASGYEPLIISKYSKLLNMTEGGFLHVPWIYSGDDRCFDILAIRYATTARGDDRLLQLKSAGQANWKKVRDAGNASIFENVRALPRAWLARSALLMSATDALKVIKTSKLPNGDVFDPKEIALVEDDNIPIVKDNGPPADTPDLEPTVTIEGYSTEEISLSIVSPKQQWLVLSDVDYPGWTATVNDEPSRIKRCDYVVRTVLVPRGHSRVQFKYEPQTFKTGLVISLSTLLLLLSLTIYWLWSAKRSKS
ncbi:MAG: YfhO family protein [Cyanobacteria bacterium SZAS TMP-1]|nr:YfhO family protein [Cyanobacteria bacterium SZAS TMP-1]